MTQVSYALREDQNSIFLLQDAGRHYDKFCQITVFGKSIIRPDFFRQYLYFAPYIGANGKYRGSATDVQISIEDNGYVPMKDYVAVIDSEVEFSIKPSVIRQLSRDYMPAWGMKSYLDYYSDRKSGILLFLKVYKVHQELNASFLEKGVRGSSQILKLYDEQGEEISLPIDIIEPVISENKFNYLKDEILHLLKVENSLISLYDNSENGLNRLQDRVNADRLVQGTKERWKDSHQQNWFTAEEDDDDFDMAQLDYEAIYQEVIQISPTMKGVVDYVRRIKAARLGEYDYYLQNLHDPSKNVSEATTRLFEMSLRSAVKNALYYHNKYDVNLEDAFQEACIGIMLAIQKHNENVTGLFPSYVGMWIRQVLGRNLSPYEYNVRIPAHYINRIVQVINQISLNIDEIKQFRYDELLSLILEKTDCERQEAYQITSILIPCESIEEIIIDSQKEYNLIGHSEIVEIIIERSRNEKIKAVLDTLTLREQDVLKMRSGIDCSKSYTLEEIGIKYKLTRERIRQIENKALKKMRHPSRTKYLKDYYEVHNKTENSKQKKK